MVNSSWALTVHLRTNVHSTLYSALIWYIGNQSGDHRSKYQARGLALGRLDMFPKTREPQFCFAGAPTSNVAPLAQLHI